LVKRYSFMSLISHMCACMQRKSCCSPRSFNYVWFLYAIFCTRIIVCYILIHKLIVSPSTYFCSVYMSNFQVSVLVHEISIALYNVSPSPRHHNLLCI
jgi:hypothetical protein